MQAKISKYGHFLVDYFVFGRSLTKGSTVVRGHEETTNDKKNTRVLVRVRARVNIADCAHGTEIRCFC